MNAASVEIPWPAIAIFVSVCSFIYTTVAISSRAHRQRVASLERQVTTLNERSKHTPTLELAGSVRELSAKVDGSVRELSTKVDGMASEVARLHERFGRYEDAVIRGSA